MSLVRAQRESKRLQNLSFGIAGTNCNCWEFYGDDLSDSASFLCQINDGFPFSSFGWGAD
jgi:hypothetical protein